jgi:hypothetical protein
MIKNMLLTIKDFLLKNYKLIIVILAGLVLLHFADYYISGFGMGPDSKHKIDSINTVIKGIEEEQKKLDSNIVNYNTEIKKVDNNISNLKVEKTIITNNYHEKIDSVNHYSDDQLRWFFTKRYGYIPQ